jgi:predicted transcriptional regulator of viral defense system
MVVTVTERIVRLFHREPRVGRRPIDVARAVNCSQNTATITIRRLMTRGFLRRDERGLYRVRALDVACSCHGASA